MEKLPKELEEKLDKMEEYLQRFGRAITAVRNGEPFDEAFDEVFLEDAVREDKLYSSVSRMMEHLLKLGYCNSQISFDYNRGDWIEGFHAPRRRVEDYLARKKNRKKLVVFANKNIQKMYKSAISLYDRSMKEYEDLKEGRKYILEQCPWTFDELMTDGPKDLVFKLPNHFRRLSDFK